MIDKVQSIFVVLLIVSMLVLVAILSTGCNSPKLGKVLLHEAVCDDDCHNTMLDICGNTYEIVKLQSILDRHKILFYCS